MDKKIYVNILKFSFVLFNSDTGLTDKQKRDMLIFFQNSNKFLFKLYEIKNIELFEINPKCYREIFIKIFDIIQYSLK